MNLHQYVTTEEMESLRRILRNEEPEALWCWEEQKELLEKCIRKRVKEPVMASATNEEESQCEIDGNGRNDRN